MSVLKSVFPITGSIEISDVNERGRMILINYIRKSGREQASSTGNGPWQYFAWNAHHMWWVKTTTSMMRYELNELLDIIDANEPLGKLKKADLEVGNYYHCDFGTGSNHVAIVFLNEEIAAGHRNSILFYTQKKWSTGDGGGLTADINNFRIATHSEIRWYDKCNNEGMYVPEDEVNSNNLVKNDLLTNNIYYHKTGISGYEYLFRYNSSHEPTKSNAIGYIKGFISIDGKYWENNTNVWNPLDKSTLREPTRAEQEWYLQCETANKYIPPAKKVTKLEVNTIYIHNNGNIVRWGKKSCIGNRGKTRTWTATTGGFSAYPNEFSFAKQDDIDWIEACEKAEKFIPFIDRHGDIPDPNFIKGRWYVSSGTNNAYRCVKMSNELHWDARFNYTTKTIDYEIGTSAMVKYFDPNIWKFEASLVNKAKAEINKKSDFIDTKISFKNKIESSTFQKFIFELGFKWASGNGTIMHTKKPYMYLDKDFTLSHSEGKSYFDAHRHREILFDDLFPVKQGGNGILEQVEGYKVPHNKSPYHHSTIQTNRIYIYTKPQPKEVVKTRIKLKIKTINLIKL